jgi:hypothetical protein
VICTALPALHSMFASCLSSGLTAGAPKRQCSRLPTVLGASHGTHETECHEIAAAS